MKTILIGTLRQLIGDRPLLLNALMVALLALIYALYVGFSLSPTDSQIATRYTAFGITHFYRDQWYYLFTFVGFGVIFGVVHAAIITKLAAMNMRSLAIAFGWLSVIILVIVGIITHAILSDIAYLS